MEHLYCEEHHNACHAQVVSPSYTYQAEIGAQLCLAKHTGEHHPAGYPSYLFAPNITEGFRLIESNEREFIFVRNPEVSLGADAEPPILDIPDVVSLWSWNAQVSYSLVTEHPAFNLMKKLAPGLSTYAQEAYLWPKDPMFQALCFESLKPGQHNDKKDMNDTFNLTQISSSFVRKDFLALIQQAVDSSISGKLENLDKLTHDLAKLIQRFPHMYSPQYLKHLARQVAALVRELPAKKATSSSYAFMEHKTAIEGAVEMTSPPGWHEDGAMHGMRKPRLLRFWQGPGTVYCEISGDLWRMFRIRSKSYEDTYERDGAAIFNSTIKFSHPEIWSDIRSSINMTMHVDNLSIYDYVKTYPNQALYQALQDYEKHIYYNVSRIMIRQSVR